MEARPTMTKPMYINGVWIQTDGDPLEVTNPVTGELVAALASAGRAEASAAIETAAAAFGSWAARPLMVEGRPQFAEALCRITDKASVPAAGGIPIMESSGQCVGAIGVSGDSSDRDAAAATSEVEPIGLIFGN